MAILEGASGTLPVNQVWPSEACTVNTRRLFPDWEIPPQRLPLLESIRLLYLKLPRPLGAAFSKRLRLIVKLNIIVDRLWGYSDVARKACPANQGRRPSSGHVCP